jgi:diacylglycerol kinase family enzyme
VPERDGAGTTGAAGYLVVANAHAGTAEQPRVDAAVATLATAGPTRLWRTGGVDELDRALDGAVAGGLVIVAVGGDGSLHAVVSRLWARRELADAVIGLVPCGTGNDFARGVDVPLEPIEAAERIIGGQPRSLDLLVDDEDHVVVNAAHAGIGAVAAERAEGLKERLGKAAYPVGAVLEAVRTDGWELTVSVDGVPLVLPGDRVLMVGVGNGPSIGGGTLLCPGADPGDGVLDVMVSCATGPAARVAFGNDLRTGSHVDRDDVVTARGTSVDIVGEPVAHDADGELSDEVARRSYRVRAGAWTLVS